MLYVQPSDKAKQMLKPGAVDHRPLAPSMMEDWHFAADTLPSQHAYTIPKGLICAAWCLAFLSQAVIISRPLLHNPLNQWSV